MFPNSCPHSEPAIRALHRSLHRTPGHILAQRAAKTRSACRPRPTRGPVRLCGGTGADKTQKPPCEKTSSATSATDTTAPIRETESHHVLAGKRRDAQNPPLRRTTRLTPTSQP